MLNCIATSKKFLIVAIKLMVRPKPDQLDWFLRACKGFVKRRKQTIEINNNAVATEIYQFLNILDAVYISAYREF